MEREWGENPLRLTVGVCIECFYIRYRKIVIGKLRRQDMKMRTDLSIWCESQDLLWCYSVSAHLHRDNIFSCDSTELWFITEKLSCGNFLKEELSQFFIAFGKKTGGEKHSRQFTNARSRICKITQKRYMV